jgi:hypothetical protein
MRHAMRKQIGGFWSPTQITLDGKEIRRLQIDQAICRKGFGNRRLA